MQSMHVDHGRIGHGRFGSRKRGRKIRRSVVGERKVCFVKHDVARDNNTASWEMEAAVASVIVRVPQNTQGRERGASLWATVAERFRKHRQPNMRRSA